MRQIMQSVVAFMILMSSALPSAAMVTHEPEGDDPVKGNAVSASENTRIITGTVFDAATNTPIAGVRVQGTGYARVTTMTDTEGNYKLTVPSYVTLLSFSTPEYGLIQRAISNKDVINVRLYSDKFSANYDESISLIASNDFTTDITSSITVDAEIQNKLGADVRSITRSGTPGVGNAMFVRGLSTLNANTQPLVEVDGVILDLQESSSSLHMGMYNNVLAGIDVSDIESVELLKNATSIYGARAANGVLRITTKRGRSMATRINANIYGSVALTPKLPSIMDAEQYRTYANELIGTMETHKGSVYPFLNTDPKYYYYNMYHNNTDWADYIYRESFAQNYKINVEGGDEIAMYNFSFGFTDAQSALKENTFNRMNIRFNSDIKLASILKTRFDISYSRIARQLFDDGVRADFTSFPVSSPSFLAVIKSPFLSPYKFNQKGKVTDTYDEADSFAQGIDASSSRANNSLYNPMTILSVGSGGNKNDQEYTHFGITVAPELKLGDFTITEIFNYSLHRMNEKYYLPYSSPHTSRQFYAEGLGRIGNFIASSFGKELQISSETRGTWSKSFGAHNIDALVGFRYTNFKFDNNFLSGANSGNDKAININKNLDYLQNEGDDNAWTNLSWFANVDYNYLTRYFLQVSASMETSSRFGRNAAGGLKLGGVKWGVFPSVQAAWLISSESWFNARPINQLKLRAGYDITGNDAIDFYACHSYLQNVKFTDKLMGLQLGNVENDGVKWETTSRVNVGLDAVLFNDRLSLSVDWYKSFTKDLLVPKAYPFVAGMEQYWANGGKMENMGVEVAINAKLINTADFQWELGATLGHYKNKVTQLDEAIDPRKVYGGEVLTQVGQPLGVFYGYKTNGIIASTAEAEAEKLYQTSKTGAKEYFAAGDVRFQDLNTQDGVGNINDKDKTVIGDPNPDIFGNIFTKLVYSDWELNIGFNYSLGNDVYNYYRQQLESGSNFFNQTTAMLNRWVIDGQTTTMPRIAYGDPMGNARFSDRWIEDGSYLKLKRIQLLYRVPVNVSWLQGLAVWASAENVFTLTKYLGNDPEFSVSNNVLYQGVDAGLLPQSRSFHLGVKVNL